MSTSERRSSRQPLTCGCPRPQASTRSAAGPSASEIGDDRRRRESEVNRVAPPAWSSELETETHRRASNRLPLASAVWRHTSQRGDLSRWRAPESALRLPTPRHATRARRPHRRPLRRAPSRSGSSLGLARTRRSVDGTWATSAPPCGRRESYAPLCRLPASRNAEARADCAAQMSAESSFRSNLAGFRWAQGPTDDSGAASASTTPFARWTSSISSAIPLRSNARTNEEEAYVRRDLGA